MSDETAKKTGKHSEPVEKTESTASASGSGRTRPSLSAARVRSNIARVLWLACLVIAIVLAAAAFTYALDANDKNGLVRFVRDLADVFDLGLFDLRNPVWQADPDQPNALVKTALANYGAAAIGYLVVGRLLERIVRP